LPILVALVAVVGTSVVAQREHPPRLVVLNYTGTVIELSALVNDIWERRGRLNPGAALPVTAVANGDRFRAAWPGGSKEHIVELQYDPSYGALQDTWVVKR
jgi:hypothetical protein